MNVHELNPPWIGLGEMRMGDKRRDGKKLPDAGAFILEQHLMDESMLYFSDVTNRENILQQIVNWKEPVGKLGSNTYKKYTDPRSKSVVTDYMQVLNYTADILDRFKIEGEE